MEIEPRMERDSQLDRRALLAAKREAALRRRRSLRRRIVTGALSLFVVAWGAVFGQSYVQSQLRGTSGTGSSQALAQTQPLSSSPEETGGYEADESSSGYAAPTQIVAPVQTVAPAPVTTSQS